MALSVSINISGNEEFMAKLKKLDAGLSDFSKPLKTIGEDLKKYYAGQAFQSMGGVYNMPWAKLAPSTQLFKKKHYPEYAANPLIATTNMRKRFTSQTTATKLVISNSAPYFVYHQSSAPRRKLPRRQMIGINSDVKSVIKQGIEKDIHQKLGLL
jgi:phage gpG-like protein